jgi:hypothetical protein
MLRFFFIACIPATRGDLSGTHCPHLPSELRRDELSSLGEQSDIASSFIEPPFEEISHP